MVTHLNFELHLTDVVTAILYVDLNETIQMEQPQGFLPVCASKGMFHFVNCTIYLRLINRVHVCIVFG
jgi:hypothetical protein